MRGSTTGIYVAVRCGLIALFHTHTHSRTCSLLLLIAAYVLPVIPSHDMNGHINETAPPLVPIGEVKLVQVQIVVWFVRTCEVWIPFVLHFCSVKCMEEISIGGAKLRCSGSVLNWVIVCDFWTRFPLVFYCICLFV
jgi:hypothetical protein